MILIEVLVLVALIGPGTRGQDGDGALMGYSSQRRKPLDKSKLKYIEIGGLFPMNGTTGWLGGQGCLPAAMMALEDVNNNEDLLAGYYLNITWNNSQVSLACLTCLKCTFSSVIRGWGPLCFTIWFIRHRTRRSFSVAARLFAPPLRKLPKCTIWSWWAMALHHRHSRIEFVFQPSSVPIPRPPSTIQLEWNCSRNSNGLALR